MEKLQNRERTVSFFDSSEEADFIALFSESALVSSLETNGYHVGYSTYTSSNTNSYQYGWYDGLDSSYSNWTTNYPTYNQSSVAQCAVADPHLDYQWINYDCPAAFAMTACIKRW